MYKKPNTSVKTFPKSPMANIYTNDITFIQPNSSILTPIAGTIVKLPSGKTAIAHGSGIERLKEKIKTQKHFKKSNSEGAFSLIKPPKIKKTAKVVTYTLAEIMEMYDKQL